MNRLLIAAFAAVTTFATAPTARADFDHPLFLAADYYRDTVREFERLSDRVRYLDPYTERAIDRLNSASNLLRSAARNPRDADRLLDRYYEVIGLQDRIEATLFAGGFVDPRLAACWNDVRRAFAVVATHFESVGAYGGAAARLPVTPDPRLDASPFAAPLAPAVPTSPFAGRSPFAQGPVAVPSPFATPSPFASAVPPVTSFRVPTPNLPRSCDTFAPSLDRFPASPFATPRRISNRPLDGGYGIPELSGRQFRSPGGDLIKIGAQLMRLLN